MHVLSSNGIDNPSFTKSVHAIHFLSPTPYAFPHSKMINCVFTVMEVILGGLSDIITFLNFDNNNPASFDSTVESMAALISLVVLLSLPSFINLLACVFDGLNYDLTHLCHFAVHSDGSYLRIVTPESWPIWITETRSCPVSLEPAKSLL